MEWLLSFLLIAIWEADYIFLLILLNTDDYLIISSILQIKV